MEIPGYEFKHPLGQGGMATVYLAKHLGLERDVAIKVMAPSLAADPTFTERFLREARIVAQLSHPGVIAVYDVGVDAGHHFISMEFHSGKDLKHRLRDGISVEDSVEIISDVAKALEFAHKKGFIHRDVKPDNILFSETGQPILTDFGIAKATDSDVQMTKAGTLMGTPRYMSPEQAQGKGVDHRSDIYSLGCIFYEMLTGLPPYDADESIAITIKHITDPIPSLKAPLDVYQHIIDKILAKAPQKRYQNASDFSRELKAIVPPRANDFTELNTPDLFVNKVDDTLVTLTDNPVPVDISSLPEGSQSNEPLVSDKAVDHKIRNLSVVGLTLLASVGVTVLVLNDSVEYFPSKIDTSIQYQTSGDAHVAVSAESERWAVNPMVPVPESREALVGSASEESVATVKAIFTEPGKTTEIKPQKQMNNRPVKKLSVTKKSASKQPVKRLTGEYLQIQVLLQSAEKLTKSGKLLNAESDGAVNKYQKVLSIDPGNKQARSGLRSIIKTLEKQLSKNEMKGASKEHVTATISALKSEYKFL